MHLLDNKVFKLSLMHDTNMKTDVIIPDFLPYPRFRIFSCPIAGEQIKPMSYFNTKLRKWNVDNTDSPSQRGFEKSNINGGKHKYKIRTTFKTWITSSSLVRCSASYITKFFKKTN